MVSKCRVCRLEMEKLGGGAAGRLGEKAEVAIRKVFKCLG
jgi:hypothetical protein